MKLSKCGTGPNSNINLPLKFLERDLASFENSMEREFLERKQKVKQKSFSDLTVWEVTKKVFTTIRFLSSIVRVPFIDKNSDIFESILGIVISFIILVLPTMAFWESEGIKGILLLSSVLLGTTAINLISGISKKSIYTTLVLFVLLLGISPVLYTKLFLGDDIKDGLIKSYTASELKELSFIIYPDDSNKEFKKIEFNPNGNAKLYTDGNIITQHWSFKDEDNICLNNACLRISKQAGYVFEGKKQNFKRAIGYLTLTPKTPEVKEIPEISFISKLKSEANLDSISPVENNNTSVTTPTQNSPIKSSVSNPTDNLMLDKRKEIIVKTMNAISTYDFSKLYDQDPFASMLGNTDFSPKLMKDLLKILSTHGVLKSMVANTSSIDFKTTELSSDLPVLGHMTIQTSITKTSIDLIFNIEEDHVVSIQEFNKRY